MAERALAHVEKIVDIRPIEGADRVELATVLGWHVMIRKDQFKVGDLAIYIEIDSKVPATEPFEFLEKKHYAVKTQKYFKGTVLSQGLLMAFEDFGWSASDFEEGQDLTEKLGITYYIPEDNQRKAPSVDKYKKMAQRHQKLFSKKPIRWLMRRDWGKKLLFLFFGKSKDKKSGWPEWVVKTDETRCQNVPWIVENKDPWVATEKIDGCLDRDVSVVTDVGCIKICEIVNKRMDVNVLTYNETLGKCEYKPIEDYHRWERVSDMYDVVVSQQGYRNGNREKHIKCTSEHSFYIGNGKYIKAKDLKLTDTIYHRFMTVDSYSKQILLGILLGDGSISTKNGIVNGSVDFSHSVKQKEYFDEIVRLLGSGNISTRIHTSGYGAEVLCGHYKTNAEFKEIVTTHCWKDGRKNVSEEWAEMLTPISLAFWYMDDGSIHNADDSNIRPTITISTNSRTKEECEILKSALSRKYNITVEIRDRASYKGNVLYMNTENTDKFASLIAPYICPSMKYKLPAYLRCISYCLSEYESSNGSGIIPTEIISISKIDDYRREYVFDLTVKDNHNYFANGILTHNTSSTYTMRRVKKRFRPTQYAYYVCSRNVVQENEDSQCYYDTNVYLEISKKYDMERKLRAILDEYPELEWVTIQGEIYGAGIQKRDYHCKDHAFMAFNLITSDVGRWPTVAMKDYIERHYGIPCVPIIDENFILPDTVDELLEMATGESVVDNSPREGLVFRSQDGKHSFKAVSNEYLLQYH